MKRTIPLFLPTLLQIGAGPFSLFALLFALHLSPHFAHASVEKAPLFLSVGEQRVLTLGKVVRYSVSGDALRYTRLPPGEQLLLKAVKPGQATLIVSRTKDDVETRMIRVELKRESPFPSALFQSLNSLASTEAIEAGEHFILRGALSTSQEAARVAYLKEHFSKFIIDETTAEEKWAIDAREQLTQFIKRYPTITLNEVENEMWVQGSLPFQGEVFALQKSLTKIYPLVHLDIQSLKDHDPTIYFKVFLLEVKKDQLTEFGMEWPSAHPASLRVSPLQFLANNPLEMTLHALSQKGTLNILSAPELVVRAPGQAEIFAGGELPIRQRSKFTDSVVWKNIGLSLKLDVQTVAGDRVRLNIETIMSHLDHSLANDDIPGVQSTHIKTQVDAPLSKPLLLSGLLQEGTQQQVKGLPLLAHLPILGKLFSSDSFQKNQSELVAVLLPYRTLPKNPLDRIGKTSPALSAVPKGFVPIPREESGLLSSDAKEALKKDKNYPWNVL